MTHCNISGSLFGSLDPVFFLIITLAFLLSLVGVLWLGYRAASRRREA